LFHVEQRAGYRRFPGRRKEGRGHRRSLRHTGDFETRSNGATEPRAENTKPSPSPHRSGEKVPTADEGLSGLDKHNKPPVVQVHAPALHVRCTDSDSSRSGKGDSHSDALKPPPDMHTSCLDLNVWSFRIDVTLCDVNVWAVDINVWAARINVCKCYIDLWKCCINVTLCDIII
jgi:hypothetical protein